MINHLRNQAVDQVICIASVHKQLKNWSNHYFLSFTIVLVKLVPRAPSSFDPFFSTGREEERNLGTRLCSHYFRVLFPSLYKRGHSYWLLITDPRCSSSWCACEGLDVEFSITLRKLWAADWCPRSCFPPKHWMLLKRISWFSVIVFMFCKKYQTEIGGYFDQ